MMRGVVLIFTLAGVPRAQPADRWLGQDKVKHFFTAAFVQSFGYGSLRAIGVSHGPALAGATSATVAASIWKERWDAGGHGTPSMKDIAWDAAGAGAATALLVKVQR